ncbi:hypothetical protein [Microbacterium sp. SORGH_AS_0888]|uniref:hypothetical protein n=1 Tax=Microbacterium sp. SORGH_AS_0888 TaxID=3041791 RepID=UPI00277E0ED3|nr:hypothetical protein [Microbacterium sp. SORGH_AS_0888]MDQ1130397.1 phosphoglycerol transferase MdoB-like AlkP superfamily enzyme [Microbacterium sp. SORGH_AS_0888]
MIAYAAEEGSVSFHADPAWMLLVVICGLFSLAALVLSIVGIVRGSRRRRLLVSIFGWAGVAFALFAALALVSFPIALVGSFPFVLFAPFVALLSIIGLVGGILSVTFSLKEPAPVRA